MADQTIQPSDLFKILNVEDNEDTRRVLSATLNFLVYLNVGDRVEISNLSFNKIGTDLIQINSKIELKSILDSFEKGCVIKFPQ